MKIEKVPIDQLILDSGNSRKHNPKNLETIKSSLAKWTQVEPLIVNKNTNIVIGGNGRLTVMRELGYKEVDVHFVNLSPTEAIALSISLNRAGELAEWDDEVLGKYLQELREEDWDLGEIGFDLSDMAKFEIPESANGKEFDESCANDVEFLECPECGHKWPK
jgi:ParB-like chromosome segregation protein Spo0J